MLNSHVPLAFTDTDFARSAQFETPELLRLYQFLLARLRTDAGKETVLSIRLPAHAVDHLKVLAARQRTTRSDVARQVISDFLRRNPI